LAIICFLSLLLLSRATVVVNTITVNTLAPNSLTNNAILANAILANAILANSLSFNALVGIPLASNNSLDVLVTMPLDQIAAQTPNVPSNMTLWYVPELMEYFVGCALNSGQSWNMTYNGTSYTFQGSLGLAPTVLTGLPSEDQMQWLSGCLMARVNFYQKHVLISLRGTAFSTVPQEEAEYTVFEGSFFGNIFSFPQQKYVCQGVGEEDELLESPDGALRVCTDPSFDCLMTNVGKCSDVCVTAEGPCTVNGTIYNDVVEVYLRGYSSGSVVLRGALFIPCLFFLISIMY